MQEYTVTESTYLPQDVYVTNMDDSAGLLRRTMTEFWHHYVIPLPNASLQVFQSFTYGEMLIASLLLALLVMFGLKWLWEVMR